MDSRKRPLQTCAISLLEIANKVYTTAIRKNFNGRVVTNSLASSLWIINLLRCPLLMILAFVDDRILGVESLAERVFPPLKKLFDGIDMVVREAEGLPPKLDGCIEKFWDLVRRVPLLDWVLLYSVSWFEFLVFVLHRLGGSKKEEGKAARKSEKQKHQREGDHQNFYNKWENVQKNDHPSSYTWSSETDETATDSDCSRTKSDHENSAQSLEKHEDSPQGASLGKVVKGSYEDLLEKADRQEEIVKNKLGRRQGGKNNSKGSKGVQEELGREVALLKGRRKGKRKKMMMDAK
ncbi:hypothetical protein LINGRAHAP2_LOCUS18309 [Linum grandiflorum]